MTQMYKKNDAGNNSPRNRPEQARDIEQPLATLADSATDSTQTDLGRPIRADWEKRVRRRVEQHFRDMRREAARCALLRAEFAEQQVKSEVCVQTSGHADKTADTVIRLQTAFRDLFAWHDVVKKTLKAFQGEITGEILRERFEKRRRPAAICLDLCIGQTTYYEHLHRAMFYAAMLAAQEGLMKI